MATLASSPLRERNAIESAAFAIVLEEPFTAASLDAVRGAAQALQPELPGVGQQSGTDLALIQQVGLTLRFDTGQMAMPAAGLRRFRSNPDGSQAWSLEAQGNLILVNCRDYTRHREVWAIMRRWLCLLIEALPDDYGTAEIGFQVVDKFQYPLGGDPEEYSITEVFSSGNPFLTSKAYEAGAFWHVFQGWFEQRAELGGRILHQVNLSNVETIEGQPRLVTVIDHRAALRPRTAPIGLKSLLEVTGDDEIRMDILFKALRQSNRILIEQALNANKLRSIGIIERHGE